MNRIRDLREDRDLRQIDVARATGIDQKTLSNYETGKTAHAHLRDLGVNFSPQDRSEIEMFLGPESSITVSDQ